MVMFRTLTTPRFSDAYSFSGVGRWQYQRVRPRESDGMLELVDPVPRDGAPVPIKG